MADIALTNAAAYAERHRLRLAERLGFGIHGTVHVAEYEGKQDKSAIKALNSAEFYLREREVYGRLRDAGVSEVLGFHVPQQPEHPGKNPAAVPGGVRRRLRSFAGDRA